MAASGAVLNVVPRSRDGELLQRRLELERRPCRMVVTGTPALLNGFNIACVNLRRWILNRAA